MFVPEYEQMKTVLPQQGCLDHSKFMPEEVMTSATRDFPVATG
jgi:hypothetical protein